MPVIKMMETEHMCFFTSTLSHSITFHVTLKKEKVINIPSSIIYYIRELICYFIIHLHNVFVDYKNKKLLTFE